MGLCRTLNLEARRSCKTIGNPGPEDDFWRTDQSQEKNSPMVTLRLPLHGTCLRCTISHQRISGYTPNLQPTVRLLTVLYIKSLLLVLSPKSSSRSISSDGLSFSVQQEAQFNCQPGKCLFALMGSED